MGRGVREEGTWHFAYISFRAYEHLKFTPRHDNIRTPGDLYIIKRLHQLLLQLFPNPLIRKNLFYPNLVERVIRFRRVIDHSGDGKVHEPVQWDFRRRDEDWGECCGGIDETGKEIRCPRCETGDRVGDEDLWEREFGLVVCVCGDLAEERGCPHCRGIEG